MAVRSVPHRTTRNAKNGLSDGGALPFCEKPRLRCPHNWDSAPRLEIPRTGHAVPLTQPDHLHA